MLKNKATCLTKILIEIYLIDDLKINMLISTDVLISNNLVIDYAL